MQRQCREALHAMRPFIAGAAAGDAASIRCMTEAALQERNVLSLIQHFVAVRHGDGRNSKLKY